MKDVALKAKVSTATVSRALMNPDKVSQSTRNKVEQAALEVGYLPQSMGRNVKRNESRTILVIVPDICDPFFSEVIRGIEVTHSKNVLIDGITVVNPDHYTVFGGEVNGLTIKNLKSFSCKGWSDGIDLMCCNDVLIDNVFMRNSDDCIAIYAHRWNFYGGSRNITLQNSILWADIAHPINIGGHGNPEDEVGEIIENITVRNVDILEHDEDDPLYQGCMTIDCGDKNLVRKVLFEDIRVESIQEGRLFHISVRFNPKYDKQPGRGVEDVIFRNITYEGVGENPSLIKGLDEKRCVRNVTFEQVMINGIRMKNINDFVSNEYIENIKVK